MFVGFALAFAGWMSATARWNGSRAGTSNKLMVCHRICIIQGVWLYNVQRFWGTPYGKGCIIAPLPKKFTKKLNEAQKLRKLCESKV